MPGSAMPCVPLIAATPFVGSKLSTCALKTRCNASLRVLKEKTVGPSNFWPVKSATFGLTTMVCVASAVSVSVGKSKTTVPRKFRVKLAVTDPVVPFNTIPFGTREAGSIGSVKATVIGAICATLVAPSAGETDTICGRDGDAASERLTGCCHSGTNTDHTVVSPAARSGTDAWDVPTGAIVRKAPLVPEKVSHGAPGARIGRPATA